MFKKIFSLFIVACFLVPQNAYALRRSLVKEFRKVVKVGIYSPDHTKGVVASGFPVSKNEFLTAGHFCESAFELTVSKKVTDDIVVTYLNDNDEIVDMHGGKIEKFEFSETQDLCLIRLDKHGIEPVNIIVNYNKVKYGDTIYAVGAPKGILPIITNGYVSLPITNGFDEAPILNNKLLFSAAITGGNSGGAVFNEKGEVVGVTVMGSGEYPHLNFAVTAIDIWRFLVN